MTPEPIYFASAKAFRKWLEKNHATEVEVWVGYHKKATGRPSMSWQQSVDQALCFGWIDGIRKTVDTERYTIRFTPRKRGSNWSRVNIDRVAELKEKGLMTAAGLSTFEQRQKSRDYSYEETRQRQFSPEQEGSFRANREAWAFFQAQPPGYRKTLIFWVTAAKKEETRARRLERLIGESAAGRRLGDSFTVRAKDAQAKAKRPRSRRGNSQ